MIRSVLAFLLAAFALGAWSQDSAEIIRIERHEQPPTRLETSLADLAEIFWPAEPLQNTLVVRASAPSAYVFTSRERAGDTDGGEIWVDVNTWRRLCPDDFTPGPVNAVLGAAGLADARGISLAFDGDESEREIELRWDRRKDDGVEQRHTVASLIHPSDGSRLEIWEIEGIGLDWCIRAAARIGIELTPSATGGSNWDRFDRYTRARSSLIRSLSRATKRVSVGVATNNELAGIVEFDSAIKPHSVQRAVDRLVIQSGAWRSEAGWAYRTLPGWKYGEREFVPAVCVGQSETGVVVVVAGSIEDAGVVMSSLQESGSE